MPKKSSAARSGAQRNKPKSQKNIQLVRPVSQAQAPTKAREVHEERENEIDIEETVDSISTSEAAEATVEEAPVTQETESTSNSASSPTERRRRGERRRSGSARATSVAAKAESVKSAVSEAVKEEEVSSAPKGSAASRLAERRQAGQRNQPRTAPSVISPEHYAYVRRDLVIIAILALIMFSVIIILHFVPGIGY